MHDISRIMSSSTMTNSKEKKSIINDNNPPSSQPAEVSETSQQMVMPGPRSTPDSCRETLRINSEEQAFHHHLTLGLQEKLQKNRMIRNVKTQFRKPVDKQTLSYWERKNGVVLPTDLKEYYQSTNGFKLTWSLEHAGDVLPIGELSINPLSQLVEIHQAAKQSGASGGNSGRGNSSVLTRPKTCSADSTPRHSSSSAASSSVRRNDEYSNNGGGGAPYTELEQTMGQARLPISGMNYSPSNKTFILDSGRSGWGKVCLVYPSPPSCKTTNSLSSPSVTAKEDSKVSTKPPQNKKSSLTAATAAVEPYVEIWFMDPSFQYYYLAPTFTHFYRMLLFHLGLPQWQYRFTPFMLSSWAEQMFWLVAPHLLQPPKLSKFSNMYHGEGLWSDESPNEAATPNPTQNVLTNQLFRRKKKDREKHNQ